MYVPGILLNYSHLILISTTQTIYVDTHLSFLIASDISQKKLFIARLFKSDTKTVLSVMPAKAMAIPTWAPRSSRLGAVTRQG